MYYFTLILFEAGGSCYHVDLSINMSQCLVYVCDVCSAVVGQV